jgi:hypothetical protein
VPGAIAAPAVTEDDFPGLFMAPGSFDAPSRGPDLRSILFPFAGTGAVDEFADPYAGAAGTGSGFRLVDPDKAPYESLSMTLFPNQDRAALRERQFARQADRAGQGADDFQENFSIDGGPTPQLTPPADTMPPAAMPPAAAPSEIPPSQSTPSQVTPSQAPPSQATPSQAAPGGGGGMTTASGGQDRMLQQDKWLALARFGAALASSQAPTFGQALGQAGQVGLDALAQARADYETRKQAAEEAALARATLAARMAGAGAADAGPSIGISADQMRVLEDLDARINQARMELGGLDDGGVFRGPDPRIRELNAQLEQLTAQRTAISNALSGLGAVANPGLYSMDDLTQ